MRTGLWFYLGALGITLVIGVVAAFVLGNDAASQTSSPKTWVAIVDVVAGVLVLAYVVRALRHPPDPNRVAGMIDRMSTLASSPAVAIVGAGATLANPGGFIPLALKEISQLDTSALPSWIYRPPKQTRSFSDPREFEANQPLRWNFPLPEQQAGYERRRLEISPDRGDG